MTNYSNIMHTKRIILLETKLFCMDMKAVTIVLTHYCSDMMDYHGDHVYIMRNTDSYLNFSELLYRSFMKTCKNYCIENIIM